MPAGGAGSRANQKTALAAVIHEKQVDPSLGEILRQLETQQQVSVAWTDCRSAFPLLGERCCRNVWLSCFSAACSRLRRLVRHAHSTNYLFHFSLSLSLSHSLSASSQRAGRSRRERAVGPGGRRRQGRPP